MSSEDWVEKRRRRSRIQATVAAVLILSALGFWFFQTGQKKAEREARMARLESLVEQADFESLKAAAKESTSSYESDIKAPVDLLSIDVRAQLLMFVLHTGDDARRIKASESLLAGKGHDETNPSIQLSEALFEAVAGSPDKALSILDGGGVGEALPDWQAIVRAEASLRKGDLPGAASMLAGRTSSAARCWAIRVAWRQGDLTAVEQTAADVLAAVPEHRYAGVMAELAAARRTGDEAAATRLRAMLEGAAPLTALNAARVTVELSRLLRRNGSPEQADALLERMLEQDESSLSLQEEYARVQRYQGLFGAARIRADKALRARADDPGLLSELAEAAFFNDAAAMINDRTRQVPGGAKSSDGVVRAEAIAKLIEGNTALAIQGLEATRHLGMPGETALWLAEAHLRAGEPARAQEEAASAVQLLGAATGEGSREQAIARMYEGLAIAAGGDVDAGREILDAAFVEPNITPWGAWLFGRFHEVAEDDRAAKDAYLLACHNGQDFALSCYDLARIYDSLPASGLHRRTQKEAREHYLRSSPKGWHAAEVKSVLGG